ncbi:hypothetical protein EON65_43820 [archaeon]|nr:MAG: hypothetical protein EON65_43820 [archaeon]
MHCFFLPLQVNVADIDPVTGVYTKTSKTYALSGFIRGHVSSLINFVY